MTLRFYVDEDSASRALRGLLARYELDVVATQEVGMSGASDEQQLEYADSVGRVIFSSNRKDFLRLHTEWMRAGRRHGGIVLLARREIPSAEVASNLPL